MNIKLEIDNHSDDTPERITATWLKKVLGKSFIERTHNGTYELQFPDGATQYLYGFWNDTFHEGCALWMSQDGGYWNEDIADHTHCKVRTEAAERIIDDLIKLCKEHDAGYDAEGGETTYKLTEVGEIK